MPYPHQILGTEDTECFEGVIYLPLGRFIADQNNRLSPLSSPKVMCHFLIEFLGLVVSCLEPDVAGHYCIV